jgi:hypothetical protein
MQTYKNYQQCTTILTNKIKYLSARYTYIPTFLLHFDSSGVKTKTSFHFYVIYFKLPYKAKYPFYLCKFIS